MRTASAHRKREGPDCDVALRHCRCVPPQRRAIDDERRIAHSNHRRARATIVIEVIRMRMVVAKAAWAADGRRGAAAAAVGLALPLRLPPPLPPSVALPPSCLPCSARCVCVYVQSQDGEEEEDGLLHGERSVGVGWVCG